MRLGKQNSCYKDSLSNGISLIMLVIAIIVIIILAGAVILALNNNNPIDTANQVVFKSDLSEIQNQLDLYITDQYIKNLGSFNENQLNGKVSDYIPTLTKYDSELKLQNGELVYIGNDVNKIEVARDKEIVVASDIVEVNSLKFNKPDISYLPEATTKAIKWDESNVESQIPLDTASSDTSWYDYSSITKHWANILTTNNGNNAYWVWIPRYAYKIDHPHTVTSEQIHITFLAGTSNSPADGSILPTDYIVHPAFNFGGKNLTGIWVAKYEASSSDSNKVETAGYMGGGNVTTLQVRVLPDVYSWRNISNANIQTVSMNMTTLTGSIGTTTNVDTHQMKNVEWGAIAYLSQSQYGQEPWINPYGDWIPGSFKLKTGYSGQLKDSSNLNEGNTNLHPYNDAIYGVKASTTHNIYGVYDMSGGALEDIAAVINNENSKVGTNGGIYTEKNKIKSEYVKYYDIYEPSDDEKEGGAYYYGTVGNMLWDSGYTEEQNVIRKSLTDGTYTKFASRKGDALWEVSNGNSYYGRYIDTGNWNWLTSTSRTESQSWQPSTGWNSDFMLVGHSLRAWLDRGGHFSDGSCAGLFSSDTSFGDPDVIFSFRPVLVTGVSL